MRRTRWCAVQRGACLWMLCSACARASESAVGGCGLALVTARRCRAPTRWRSPARPMRRRSHRPQQSGTGSATATPRVRRASWSAGQRRARRSAWPRSAGATRLAPAGARPRAGRAPALTVRRRAHVRRTRRIASAHTSRRAAVCPAHGRASRERSQAPTPCQRRSTGRSAVAAGGAVALLSMGDAAAPSLPITRAWRRALAREPRRAGRRVRPATAALRSSGPSVVAASSRPPGTPRRPAGQPGRAGVQRNRRRITPGASRSGP